MSNASGKISAQYQSSKDVLAFEGWERVLNGGKVFKNYKDMCSQLQLSPTTGKAKQLQFKELGRFCTYHKEGHQIVIDEVFNEPEPKIDGRSNNRGVVGNSGNSIYGELMDILVIDMFLSNEELMYGTALSFSQIFMEEIPLLSDTYGAVYNMGGAHVYAIHQGLSVGLVTEYMVKTREILKKCLETSFNRLQRKGILEWKKCFVIKVIGSYAEVATDEQEKIIKRCEQEAYDELKISYYDRINPSKNNEFKKVVLKKIHNVIPSPVETYWSGYEVYFEKKDHELDCDIEEKMQELQELIVKRVHKAIINKSCINKKTNERFTPYKAESHLRAIHELDYKIWNQLSKEFKDDLNQEFSICIYGEETLEEAYLFKNEKLA